MLRRELLLLLDQGYAVSRQAELSTLFPPPVAALHAGAAIHCWPNPSAALAEISRVLRPGGLFVASTVSEGPKAAQVYL